MAGVPSKANNSSQYSSNRTSRSSTSTIFSSHVESLISRSWSLSSKAPNRSHGAARWSLRVCDFSSCSKSAVVRNLSKRVCRSVRSESARSSLICVSECAKGSTGPVPEWMIYDVAAFSRTKRWRWRWRRGFHGFAGCCDKRAQDADARKFYPRVT